MKTAAVLFVVAGLLAAVTAAVHNPLPLEHRLIHVQAGESLPGFPGLDDQPVEVQAALVDLSGDPLLRLKAQAAVMAYPDMARQILPLYAQEPEFRDVLRRYGESVLPPVAFFLDNPVGTVESLNFLARHYDRARSYFSGDSDNTDPAEQQGRLTPEQRGWYAVNFIDAEGHGFLGQFKVAEDGSVHWIQTERITEGVTDFLTSGIRGLETRHRTGEDISVADIGWASVDVLVFASAVKLLRAGRAVAAGTRTTGVSTRSAALAARVTGAGRMVLRTGRYARWPVIIGAGYLVVRHPAVISDVLAEAAAIAGLPGWAGQWLGWTLILVPVLLLLRWLLVPLTVLLRGLVPVLAWLSGRARGRGGFRGSAW
ncbi:MAG: hypothetical protein ACOCVV_10205 [Marinobacter sp.]